MDRATKVAVEKYPRGTFDGEIGDSLRAACTVGYMQAQKDLELTADEIRLIFNEVRFKQAIYNTTEGCYQEVADWFNEQRKK